MQDYLKTDFDFESDELLEVFDELPIWSAAFGQKLLDNINYRKGIAALDIGFGAGFPLTEIAMRLGNTSKIYGLDPWKAANRRALKKISYFGIQNVEIIDGVAENIPLKDQSIDLLTSNNGLNNVKDLERALKECARVLKTGGQFLHSMNLNTTMAEFYDELEKVLSRMGCQKEVKEMHRHIHTMRKPIEEIQLHLESNGLTLKNIIHDKFHYKFTDGTAFLNHYYLRLGFLDGWKSCMSEELQPKVFAEVEKEINAKAEKQGGFTLTVPYVLIDCLRI